MGLRVLAVQSLWGLCLVLVILLAPDLRDGYMQHWNFTLQYQPRADIAVDAAYVGSKGSRLTRTRDAKQTALPWPCPEPFSP
ncbi:MAG: hypothetical protein ACRD4U_11615 [Candidatus Acidiferrales bacterium]